MFFRSLEFSPNFLPQRNWNRRQRRKLRSKVSGNPLARRASEAFLVPSLARRAKPWLAKQHKHAVARRADEFAADAEGFAVRAAVADFDEDPGDLVAGGGGAEAEHGAGVVGAA